MEKDTFCKDCGSRLNGDGSCPNCSQPAAEAAPVAVQAKKTKSRAHGSVAAKILAVVCALLALALVVTVASSASGSKSFATPAAAIKYYSRMIRSRNIDKALSAFSSQEKTDNFDYGKYIEATDVYNSASQPLPEGSRFNDGLNLLYFKTQNAREIKTFCLSLLLPGDLLAEMAENVGDAGYTVAQVEEMLDTDALRSLRLADCDPIPAAKVSDAYKSYIALINEAYGITERVEYYALYHYSGEYYLAHFTLVKIDGRWQIDSLTSSKSSTWLTKTTKAEYNALVRG